MLAGLCSGAQSTGAGLGHSEVDLMAKLGYVLKQFGPLNGFVTFGAARRETAAVFKAQVAWLGENPLVLSGSRATLLTPWRTLLQR